MAAENIDNTVNGSGLFPAKVPGLSDAADIQAALRLYHYGSYTYDGSNTNTANLVNPSIAKHLQNLVDADAAEIVNRNAAIAVETTNRNTAITTHNSATTNVHGIANTANLATQAYVINALEGAAAEYPSLAGDGLEWNGVDERFDLSDSLLLVSPKEKINISSPPANGIVNVDIVTSSANVITSNATGNYTINVRGDSTNTLNSLMQIGDSITVVFESPNGSTAYYATGYTIDGNAVTPKWLGGTAPSVGNINATDLYMLQIRKTDNATFTCLASQSKFS